MEKRRETPMSTSKQQLYWEEIAEIDPYWAILGDPKYRYGKWDIQDFFHSGEQQVLQTMNWVSLHGYPHAKEIALDFGCGIGRLTRALSGHFREVHGFDFSKTMITRAKELNAMYPNCRFDLIQIGPQDFQSNHYDLIYCVLVLQHLPARETVKEYIREFLRAIKPNGLIIFQLPHHISLLYRLQVQRRIYSILRLLGFTTRFIHHRLGLTPIGNICAPEAEIARWLDEFGATLLDTESSKTGVVQDTFYYVTKKS
jgi:2-polyprenyl-3-methyl-5-hydroxy-6-metoxy-1,4-benzoquinol methylase